MYRNRVHRGQRSEQAAREVSRTRRALTLAVTGASVIALAACGNSSDSADSAKSGGSNGGSKKATIGYATNILTDPYQTVVYKYSQENAKKLGLDLLPAANAAGDPGKQITDVQTLVNQGIDGLLLIVSDSDAIKPALDYAEKRDVPVVVIDQPPNAGKVFMIVRADNVAMGTDACKALGEKVGGSGKVLEIQGDLSGLAGQQRTQGFNDCIKKDYPKISVISKEAHWSGDEAATVARTVLSTNPDIKGVYIHSDSVYASPLVTVLKSLGKLKPEGDPKHLAVVSIDGTSFALQQVKKGFFDTVVSQPADQYAKLAADYIRAAVDGKTFKVGPSDHNSQIVEFGNSGNLADNLPAVIVTKENVDEPTLWGNAS